MGSSDNMLNDKLSSFSCVAFHISKGINVSLLFDTSNVERDFKEKMEGGIYSSRLSWSWISSSHGHLVKKVKFQRENVVLVKRNSHARITRTFWNVVQIIFTIILKKVILTIIFSKQLLLCRSIHTVRLSLDKISSIHLKDPSSAFFFPYIFLGVGIGRLSSLFWLRTRILRLCIWKMAAGTSLRSLLERSRRVIAWRADCWHRGLSRSFGFNLTAASMSHFTKNNLFIICGLGLQLNNVSTVL